MQVPWRRFHRLPLAAYVRGEGWAKSDEYGQHADIYVGDDRPELVLPRTDRLTDYVAVVSRLIGILCEADGQDESPCIVTSSAPIKMS